MYIFFSDGEYMLRLWKFILNFEIEEHGQGTWFCNTLLEADSWDKSVQETVNYFPYFLQKY